MKVLAHIHTFNDADIIDRTIEGVLRQTRPVDGILLVDNASTDGTLDRPSVRNTTVLRHSENLGTSGAVHSGFSFALQHGYDWIWVFDADSIPEPDALEKLLTLYSEWPSSQQNETAFLACLARNSSDGKPIHGQIFTRHGVNVVREPLDRRWFLCHVVIWSGCLYRVAAVSQIGLPNPDYVLDVGEIEYGYQVMRAGFKGFIYQDAVMHHNIRGSASITPARIKLGPVTLRFFDFAPIRCYYTCRNEVYFALYEAAQARLWLVLRRTMFGLTVLVTNFLLRPRSRAQQIRACFRGIWHGLTGNIAARY